MTILRSQSSSLALIINSALLDHQVKNSGLNGGSSDTPENLPVLSPVSAALGFVSQTPGDGFNLCLGSSNFRLQG